MDELTVWSAVAGAVLPPLIAVVNQPRWARWVRALVTVGVCVAAGAFTAHLQGAFTGGRWLQAGLVVAFAAVGTYRAYWHPSGIAPAVEQATSVR